uniref:C2 NT-type domain-containing protein n=1 Tax=Tetradesmus obliquus TaxID=3088 RepID=A0A383VEV2_TETOB|eukprot:jgi/Sobl393_1/17937/SZX64085.1
MLQKFRNRINATRFEFTIHVHTLQPWPAGSKAVAIGWQRGKRRRGATSSVLPLPSKDKLGTVVRLNEKFTLTSSLYKVPGADRNSQLGPFKKKCLILAVLETDGRTHATAALGRIVIDLSEFASIDGQELRTFAVACNKSIHAAVGEPHLTVTIRCHWKKAGADMTEDEVASMSTDTTGSGLATNIRDFFSLGKGGKANKRTEQDLKGFAPGQGGDTGMATIGEDEGGEDEGGGIRSRQARISSGDGGASSGKGFQEAEDVDFDSNRGSLEGAGWGAQDLEYDAVGALNLHDDDEFSPAQRQQHSRPAQSPSPHQQQPPPLPLPPQQVPGYSSSMGPSSVRSVGSGAADGAAAPAGPADMAAAGSSSRRWRMEGVDAAGAAGLSRSMEKSSSCSSRPSKTIATQTELADITQVEPQLDDVSSLQDELLMSAAVEFAIYNAQRPLLPGRLPSRSVHAPARRIARTLVCLGRQDGLPFGQLALRQLSACVVAGRSDIRGLATWWSNAVHLRGFLQSLNLALAEAAGEEGGPRHWAAEAFVPRLLQQEKFIFDELVSYVWTHTFVPAVAASRARPANAALAAGVVKRSGQEAALRKWLGALEAVSSQLKGLGREGHTSTLRHQVLLEVMKRMDTLIFHFLITPPSDSNSEGGSSSNAGAGGPLSPGESSAASRDSGSPSHAAAASSQVLHDPLNPNMPMLDDSMLFFQRGVLTFGTGMHLKMACTRFQQWAFGEGGMREIWANLPAQGQSLFPLLRSTSDLLMMPKDLLLEEGIRSDMCENLALPTLVFMLNRFQPDDFSREGIPYEVLGALRQQAGGADVSVPPRLQVEGECTYYSPTDDMAMEKVEVGEEPGLEYDADSEDELDALGGLCGEPSAGLPLPLRFKLLHNLWGAGVPRSRRITIVRAESGASTGLM